MLDGEILKSATRRSEVRRGSGEITPSAQPLPSIFQFTDYREFLREFFGRKKENRSSYSHTNFVKRAGLGINSRGYVKLVIEGKRNLSSHSTRGFADALGLKAGESIYFENLVYFNQAKTDKDKQYYFQRVMESSGNRRSPQYELLESQYYYYSFWYYPTIRQIVGLKDFQEDAAWISAQLRNKVSKKEVLTALSDLTKLGLLKRDENGKLIPSDPIVKFGDKFNFLAQKFQLEMMDRAKETILEDPYEERNASSVTLTCSHEKLPELRKFISAVRDELVTKFVTDGGTPDTVFQINFQIFQLTPLKKPSALLTGSTNLAANSKEIKS